MLIDSLILSYNNFISNNRYGTIYIYMKGRMYKKNKENYTDNSIIHNAISNYTDIKFDGYKIEFSSFDSLSLSNVEYYYSDGYNYFILIGEDNYILFSRTLDDTLMDKDVSWMLRNYSSKHIMKLYDTIDELQKKLDELDNKISKFTYVNNDFIIGVPHSKPVKFPSSLPDDVNFNHFGITLNDSSVGYDN